jgi:hypothetical protein
MPEPTDEVRPEEFRRGPAPGVCDSEMEGERGPEAGVLQSSEASDAHLPLVRSPTRRMLAQPLYPGNLAKLPFQAVPPE